MMQLNRKDLSDEQLIQFYKSLLLPRMIEEKMLVLLRQGKFQNGLAVSARRPLRLGQHWLCNRTNG
jgi:2-oxoisovalerate dehydrogenase E1 component